MATSIFQLALLKYSFLIDPSGALAAITVAVFLLGYICNCIVIPLIKAFRGPPG